MLPRSRPALRPLLLLLAHTLAGAAAEAGEDWCASVHIPKNRRCKGCPPKYKGKLCASTTRYNDQTRGACGCSDSEPAPKHWWSKTNFTAAQDCKNLDPVHPLLAWCPAGCGACYKLCSTGGSMHGHRPEEGVCKVFKITNRCGDGYMSEEPHWCSNRMTWKECEDNPEECKRVEHNTNHYGYPAHFDLQDLHHQISHGLKWDNVEVTFEPVPCEDKRWGCHCDPKDEQLGLGTGSHGHHEQHTSATTSKDKDADAQPPGGDGRETTTPRQPSSDKCGKEWEQCGGKSLSSAPCCEEGCECKHLGDKGNEHYSHQCIPTHWKGCKHSAKHGITSKFDEGALQSPVQGDVLPQAGSLAPFYTALVFAAALLAVAVAGRAAICRLASARRRRSDEEEASTELLSSPPCGQIHS